MFTRLDSVRFYVFRDDEKCFMEMDTGMGTRTGIGDEDGTSDETLTGDKMSFFF